MSSRNELLEARFKEVTGYDWEISELKRVLMAVYEKLEHRYTEILIRIRYTSRNLKPSKEEEWELDVIKIIQKDISEYLKLLGFEGEELK